MDCQISTAVVLIWWAANFLQSVPQGSEYKDDYKKRNMQIKILQIKN